MLSGHFINSPQGQLFVTQFGEVTGNTAILCLPSIVEEMNRSRAVIAKQAQNFAKQGLPCFVLDYFGTGDSEGEFEQANADIWLENIIVAGEFIQKQGFTKIILWGIRFGGLLILAHQKVLHEKLPIVEQILWKPVTNGKLFSGQFLRIKQASNMLNQSLDIINWRNHILEGNNTEVAGYLITKNMLNSWESLQVSANFQPLSTLHWFELAAKEITPLTRHLTALWKSNMVKVYCFDCPPFWQVPEVFALPKLEQLNAAAIF